MKFLLKILSLFFLIVFSKTDLPVHCLAKEIAGEWRFFISEYSSPHRLTCGHMIPDKNTDHIYSSSQNNENYNIINLILKLPNQIYDKNEKLIGKWTMVYDEGFELRLNNGDCFFTFNKYRLKEGFKANDNDDFQVKGYESICYETFLGWKHENQGYRCFKAEKTIKQSQSQENSLELIDDIPKDRIVQRNLKNNNGPIEEQSAFKSQRFLNEMNFYSRFMSKSYLYDLPHLDLFETGKENQLKQFIPDFNFIELINSIDTSWKAKYYPNLMLNKTFSSMRSLIGLSNEKIHKMKTIKNNEKIIFTPRFLQKSHGFLKEKSTCDGEIDGLPRCFDWRKVDGINYDTPIKKQGDCGSCYALAILSALESRIRIKSKMKYQPFLAPSSAVSCSQYNQGCNGGYPFLTAKEGFETGFFESECNPLINSGTCQNECFQTKVWKIRNYNYVGDYYGNTDDKKMKKEIFNGGPIVVAFNASPDLYYYTSGVFMTNPKAISQSNDNPDIKDWMFTNHAVVCVGWGETMHEGEKINYWILKNSWGEEWGENGYFRMVRGVNLGAIENQAVYMEPIIEF